ncbi:MAG: hypothetical protein AAGU11_22075 [Syntrophobacteraceae bacterium]
MEPGERSDPDGTEGALAPVDPEVRQAPLRRRFSAEYKLRILRLADTGTDQGSLGPVLRRKGPYASNLKTWRPLRDSGTLKALRPEKRGRKLHESNPLSGEAQRSFPLSFFE